MRNSPPDQLDALPARRSGLIVRPISGELVIYDPGADLLHHLDPNAAAVWDRLTGDRTLRQVAADIATAYGIDDEAVRGNVRDDVLTTAVLLDERGLLAGSVAERSSPRPDIRTRGELDFDLTEPLPEARHVSSRFRGLEHVFDVATNDPAVRIYLDEILADLSAAGGTGAAARYELIVVDEAHYVVRCDGRTIVATGRLDRALAVLLWHVNAEAVRTSTSNNPVVHAAAAVNNGATVLMPAPPGVGKTTTVAGLVSMAGFGYLTDEAVAIDPTTYAPRPYPKPFSIDRGSWHVLAPLRPAKDPVTGQWLVPATSVRPDAIGEPAPIRFVVEPAYDPDATTRLEPVPKAAMLVHLADSTFDFPAAAERNLQVLAEIVTRADCYRMPVSDLGESVKLISELFTSTATY